MKILGIDTSNYTTSCALVGDDGIISKRKILDVGEGKRGLRQSDALFLHTVNLPEIIGQLGQFGDISAVAVSARPRDTEGSYMPCFLAGILVAESVRASLSVPLQRFSHQAGHIMAAVKSCEDNFSYDEFLAFHLSGGTDELLYVKKDDTVGFKCEIVSNTLDITAGQLIDRTGVMLGLKFPCGAKLESLASECDKKDIIKLKAKVTDGCCNLSGMENRIKQLIDTGTPNSVVALSVLACVENTINSMIKYGREKYNLPVICVGGVISDAIIRDMLKEKTENIYFGSRELSSDNAVGTAYLGYEAEMRRNGKS